MDHADCVVVGAGVVGLAVARALARQGSPVLVCEAAPRSGEGTSGRGSGVIHAGLYYPPGSLKATLCVRGREALFAFAQARSVPVRRLGKLVVATTEAEIEPLIAIAARARENGVDDTVLLDAAQAKALEPALHCTAALLSPSTGVIDAHRYMDALRDDAEEFGAVCAFSAPVETVTPTKAGFVLSIGAAAPMHVGCRLLVNAAGHGAPALARRIEGLDGARVPQAYLAKGNYFATETPPPFARLIYPLPVPGGIGTHLTIGPRGDARFGPDVEWVDKLDYTVDPARAGAFAADIRRWWPALPDDALRPAGSGIRPKIAARGEPARDFAIEGPAVHGLPGLVNLFGIESPGVTASLAIADHVVSLLSP